MERDALIERYAKKIFGFACQKTQNRQEAEDLSQSILPNSAKCRGRRRRLRIWTAISTASA